jgi:putative sterol carrier protein
MADQPLSAAEVFEKHIPERLSKKPDISSHIKSSYQFALTGDGGGDWYVDLSKGGTPEVKAGKLDAPGVTITMTAKDFVDLVSGKLNGQMAFMQGKLKIKGDMALALKLQQILS